MINRLGPIADAEAVDQRGRLLIAGYAVKRLSASLSPRDRRESGRAVPRGAHRARSALSASSRESAAAARAARETLGLLGRNGEAPSDRSLGASVYRPSSLVRNERGMAPHRQLFANPFAGLSAGRVLPARAVLEMRTLANPGSSAPRGGTLSRIRAVLARRGASEVQLALRSPSEAACARFGTRRGRASGHGTVQRTSLAWWRGRSALPRWRRLQPRSRLSAG